MRVAIVVLQTEDRNARRSLPPRRGQTYNLVNNSCSFMWPSAVSCFSQPRALGQISLRMSAMPQNMDQYRPLAIQSRFAVGAGILLANLLLAEHAAGLALLKCKCQPLFTDPKPRPKPQSAALGPFQFIQGVIT